MSIPPLLRDAELVENPRPEHRVLCAICHNLSNLVLCPNGEWCSVGYVERTNLEAHLSRCAGPCPFGCGNLVHPRTLQEHRARCTSVRVQCSAVGCDWSGPRLEAIAHAALCVKLAAAQQIPMVKQ